jgi:hypothetical protein
MGNASFFDLNTLITINSKVWIVDKLNPNVPVLKISKADFNLVKKGIYKKDNAKLDISGKTYWISEGLMNSIKIRCKNMKVDISNLSFSMQEFMNKDIIENGEFTIHTENITHLKNTQDDIYIICSKNNEDNYKLLISKLEKELDDIGLKVKLFYYVSETFYNRNDVEIAHKKAKIIIQHLIGLKTEIGMFTNEEVTKYDTINFYEDNKYIIGLIKNSNDILHFLISNSEDSIKDIIKEVLRSDDCNLIINQVTFNKVNTFIKTYITLSWNNIIKKFENFKFRF